MLPWVRAEVTQAPGYWVRQSWPCIIIRLKVMEWPRSGGLILLLITIQWLVARLRLPLQVIHGLGREFHRREGLTKKNDVLFQNDIYSVEVYVLMRMLTDWWHFWPFQAYVMSKQAWYWIITNRFYSIQSQAGFSIPTNEKSFNQGETKWKNGYFFPLLCVWAQYVNQHSYLFI